MWNGEIVVYDDRSGDTLKLDVVMAEIFRHLLDRAATEEELAKHLAFAFDLDIDPKLQRLTQLALDRFQDCGLLVPSRDLSVAPGSS